MKYFKDIWGDLGGLMESGGLAPPAAPRAHHLAGTQLAEQAAAGHCPAGPTPSPPSPPPRSHTPPGPAPALHSYGAAEAAAILAAER